MSKRKGPPQTPPRGTPLTGSRLVLAYELARQGIAMLLPDHEIVTSIVEQCKTTERSAAAALQKVAKQGAKLSASDKEALRDTLHFRYEHLYAREVQAGRNEGAAKMLDRRARLAGLFKEEKAAAVEVEADEFEGRSVEDLHYFRQHGYFPEDKPANNVVQLDPLAKIRRSS